MFAIMSPPGSPGAFVSATAKSLFDFPSANGILGRSHGHHTVSCSGVHNGLGPYLAGLDLRAVSGGGDDRRVGGGWGATAARVDGALVREQRAAVHDAFDGV